MVGRAKEKMLMSKMISILTPVKNGQLTSDLTDITFENLLIFLATISNIEIPYNDDVMQEMQEMQEMLKMKSLSIHNGNKSWLSDKNYSDAPVGNGFQIENVNERSNLEMKMSLSLLQNLLPARESQLI
jgi:hypothetical protein